LRWWLHPPKSKAKGSVAMENQKAVPRSMDELGRVVVPRDIRESLGWGDGTRLEVAIIDITVKSIIVKEASPSCSLCRAKSKDLVEIEKGYICPECAAQIT